MNLEVLLLTEGLITARKGTLEWLRPIMNMHVSFKVSLSREGLTAAWMLTDKKLRPFLSVGWTTRTTVFVFFLCLIYAFHLQVMLSPLCTFDFSFDLLKIMAHHFLALRYFI